MPCHWVFGSLCFEGTTFLQNFLGTDYPAVQCHAPKEWNPQPHLCENLKTYIEIGKYVILVRKSYRKKSYNITISNKQHKLLGTKTKNRTEVLDKIRRRNSGNFCLLFTSETIVSLRSEYKDQDIKV
jgi:hypothetical protein